MLFSISIEFVNCDNMILRLVEAEINRRLFCSGSESKEMLITFQYGYIFYFKMVKEIIRQEVVIKVGLSNINDVSREIINATFIPILSCWDSIFCSSIKETYNNLNKFGKSFVDSNLHIMNRAYIPEELK